VLMQDHARFRDNSYLRKQKKVVMREMLERFDQMIRTVRTAQGEDRFLSQPTTDLLVSLVHECLVRFTPWDTSCVIPEGFDPLARIPALAFSGTDPDNESPIEMNRIHAIVDPDCFSRLVASLGFAPPNERLAAPRFFYSDGNLPRGDRLNPPPLSEEHRLRLKRAREDSARRRKTYRVGQLRIYIDDIESISFDPRRMTTVEFKLPVAAKMIEVIGQDEQGDLPLATLLVAYGDIPSEGSLSDSLTLEGGQQLTIVLTPVGTANGEIEQVEVELGYAETQPLRALSWLTQRALFGLAEVVGIRRKESEELKIDYSWFVKAAIALALMLGVLMIIWRQLRPTQRDFSVPPRQVELMPTPATELSPTPPPVQTPVRPQNQRTPAAQIARVAWNKDPHAVDNAIRLEVRRGGVPNVEISNTTATLLLAVNNADSDKRPYHRYRLILTAAEKSIWERILQAPKVTSGSHAYVLTLEFSPERFPKADSYRLQIEGETQAGWQSVGQLILNPVTH